MESKTFEDPFYLIELEIAPHCQVSATVTIQPEEMKRLYKKAVKLVSKQISIPGFRKGKAPDSAIVSRYAPSIEKEWKELVLKSGVEKAVVLSQLPPFMEQLTSSPRLINCDQETGGKLSFTYEHAPKIADIDCSKLSIEQVTVSEVTEDQIQQVVQSILTAEASHEEIDKAVEADDYVRITIENHDTHALLLDHYLLHVQTDKIVPWLIKIIIGMKAGEEKEGETEGENNIPVKVTIHQVLKAVVPELSEEIAKKVGASSIEDLLVKIRKNLEKEALEEQRALQLKALDNALIASCPFELPASWYRREIEERTKQYLKHTTPTEEERVVLDQDIAQKAERALRIHFLHQKLIWQHKISIDQSELSLALLRARIDSLKSGKIMEENPSAEELDQLRFDLIRHKAREHALALALGKPLTTDDKEESVS